MSEYQPQTGLPHPLFDFEPSDPHVLPADVKRLNGHNRRILDLLMKGRVTTADLADISKNHTARISNLRKLGYEIKCIRGKNGLNQYELISAPDAPSSEPE